MAVVGLEIFHSTIESEISSPSDALVGLLHWLMINNGFLCIGKGETINPKESVKASEKLPRDWNGEEGVYCLLYRMKGGADNFLLKVILLEDCLLINLMRLKDNQVADISIHIKSYCTGDLSSYEKVYKNVDDLNKKLRAEVLGVFEQGTATASGIGTDRQPRGQRREPDGGEEGSSQSTPTSQAKHYTSSSQRRDPFAVGRGDLDPLHAGAGGGMLMDPLRSGGLPARDRIPGGYADNLLPRGAVPPGARYDPMGPPDFGNDPRLYLRGRPRGGPDSDHMRPPGFEDDMFS